MHVLYSSLWKERFKHFKGRWCVVAPAFVSNKVPYLLILQLTTAAQIYTWMRYLKNQATRQSNKYFKPSPVFFSKVKIPAMKKSGSQTRPTTRAKYLQRVEVQINKEEDTGITVQTESLDTPSPVPIVKVEENDANLKLQTPRHENEKG